MTRTALLQLLKGQAIEDLLETDIWRENEPLVICGFRTSGGYTVHLKSIPGSDSVTISVNHEASEAERRSFLEKLRHYGPDSFFDFRLKTITIDEVCTLVKVHAKSVNAGGSTVTSIWNDEIRVRLDPVSSFNL